MKHLLLTTIAAVVLVGCATTQSPVTYLAAPHWTSPKPPTAKAPDISINQAVFDGNIEAVKQHLAAGTDVNAKDDNGWTSLHFAVYYGHKEIVELMIAKGADVNAKDEYGYTLLDRAGFSKQTEIADLIRQHGGKTKKELEAEGK